MRTGRFEAELLVLNHPSRVRVNYEPVVHISCIKQSAKLISIRRNIQPTNAAAVAALTAGTTPASAAGPAPPPTLQNTHTGVDAVEDANGEEGGEDLGLGNGDRAICRYSNLVFSPS